jgi:hypothetical protein
MFLQRAIRSRLYIAAHGTQTALDVLLEIHTGATISLKGAVMDSLETLAGPVGRANSADKQGQT